MSSLSEQYQAERRRVSSSGIYRPPAPAPAPVSAVPRIYAESTYQGLSGYTTSGPVSKFSQRAGESDQAYVNRLRPLTAHLAEQLPADELATVTGQYNEAVERLNGGQTHADLRQHLATRQGVGTGIMGNSTATERAAVVGSRFGGREIQAQGQLIPEPVSGVAPMSASEINAVIRQREAARQGQIPTGSSGEGIFVR